MEVAVEVKNEAINFVAQVRAENLGSAPSIAGGLDPVATSVRPKKRNRPRYPAGLGEPPRPTVFRRRPGLTRGADPATSGR